MENIISIKRTKLTPELLGLTLLSLRADIDRNGVAATTSVYTVFPNDVATPAPPSAWRSELINAADRLNKAKVREIAGVGRVVAIEIPVPRAVDCPKCGEKNRKGGA